MDELLTELLCQRDENKALKDHIRLLNFILCLAVPCWFVAVGGFVKMDDTYRRLWILLREKLTRYENKDEHVLEKETYHAILTEMAFMEAAEFLED